MKFNTEMKQLMLILLFLFLLNRVKGQGIDSLRISPNPFDTSIAIYYSVANTDSVTFRVFNILGQVIKIFINDSLVNAGAYTINYNSSSLPNGVYFFSLNTKDSTLTKKGIKQAGVGINQIVGESTNLFIYPNPAINIISLNVSDIVNYQNAAIAIQNSLGQTIKKLSFTKNIDVSDLLAGCYFLQITLVNAKSYKTKFIKQ